MEALFVYSQKESRFSSDSLSRFHYKLYLTKLKTAFSLSPETGMLRHIAFCIYQTFFPARRLGKWRFLTYQGVF